MSSQDYTTPPPPPDVGFTPPDPFADNPPPPPPAPALSPVVGIPEEPPPPPPPPAPAPSPVVGIPEEPPPPPPPVTPAPSPDNIPLNVPAPPPPPPPPLPPPPTVAYYPPPPPQKTTLSPGATIGIAVGIVLLLAVLASVIFIWFKRKKKTEKDSQPKDYVPPSPANPKGALLQQWNYNQPSPEKHVVMIPEPSPVLPPRPINNSGDSWSVASDPAPLSRGVSLAPSIRTFTYEELATATDGFSEANFLGEGGFGYVHRGVLRNGKDVAIKQLKAGSVQGDREFQTEVEIISRVHHRHLVSLVGYCIDGVQRMLVYEFVPNFTLEFHLHGKGRPRMEFSTRLHIAIGAAKGLAYLHEDCHPKIIHRDIKAANILLDFKFDAKVADFGLAKLVPDINTHVSTRVMGTFGYLAPEYAYSGKLTEKSDVYSFGVLLLELITGLAPVVTADASMNGTLVDWAKPLLTQALQSKDFDALVDKRIKDYNHDKMGYMIACAAACVRQSAHRRPKISLVVRALEGDVSLADLNDGVEPGQSNDYKSNRTSDNRTDNYSEDINKFRKMVFESQEFATSQYNKPNSENWPISSSSSSEGKTIRETGIRKKKAA